MTEREALKLALEALETSLYPQQKQLQAITAIREVLAQPEQPAQQEHVATSDTSEKRVDEMAKQRHEQEPVIDKSAAVRIATALGWTPQRKPLTDEEIEDLYFDKFSMGELNAFARAIEAAHGIFEDKK